MTPEQIFEAWFTAQGYQYGAEEKAQARSFWLDGYAAAQPVSLHVGMKIIQRRAGRLLELENSGQKFNITLDGATVVAISKGN
jgi:hypothetical protein